MFDLRAINNKLTYLLTYLQKELGQWFPHFRNWICVRFFTHYFLCFSNGLPLTSHPLNEFISRWTVIAYIYNTVYSELTACNSTLTRWLQHRYKQWPHQPHAGSSQVDYIAYSDVCWRHNEIIKLQHRLQLTMLVTLAWSTVDRVRPWFVCNCSSSSSSSSSFCLLYITDKTQQWLHS